MIRSRDLHHNFADRAAVGDVPQRGGHLFERVVRADVRPDVPARRQRREFVLVAPVFGRIEILARARERTAAATPAVLWNAAGPGLGLAAGPGGVDSAPAALLRDTLAELGSAATDSDAALIAHATIGTLAERLRQRSEPAPDDVERITAFCLRALIPAGPE